MATKHRTRFTSLFGAVTSLVCLQFAAIAQASEVIIFQRGNHPTPSYQQVYSNNLYSTATNTPQAQSGSLSVNWNQPGERSVIYFDVSQIPSGSAIISAELECYFFSYIGSVSVKTYQVTTNWRGGVSWSNPGGDWVDSQGTPQGNVPFDSELINTANWHGIDITGAVQQWVNGSSPNYGILLTADNIAWPNNRTIAHGASQTVYFYAPKLTVTYDIGGGGDTIPPTGSININGGAATTDNVNVTITASASDNASGVSEMRFSNNAGSTWSAWQTYVTTPVNWTLTSGDGLKTVHAQFKDGAGNVSTATITDTIILDTTVPDTTPPTGSITINSGATHTSTLSVTLNLAASDDAGTVDQVRIANDAGSVSSATPQAFSEPSQDIPWTLQAGADGQRTVYVQFIDDSGNVSNTYNDTIILDTSGSGIQITSHQDGQIIQP